MPKYVHGNVQLRGCAGLSPTPKEMSNCSALGGAVQLVLVVVANETRGSSFGTLLLSQVVRSTS